MCIFDCVCWDEITTLSRLKENHVPSSFIFPHLNCKDTFEQVFSKRQRNYRIKCILLLKKLCVFLCQVLSDIIPAGHEMTRHHVNMPAYTVLRT